MLTVQQLGGLCKHEYFTFGCSMSINIHEPPTLPCQLNLTARWYPGSPPVSSYRFTGLALTSIIPSSDKCNTFQAAYPQPNEEADPRSYAKCPPGARFRSQCGYLHSASHVLPLTDNAGVCRPITLSHSDHDTSSMAARSGSPPRAPPKTNKKEKDTHKRSKKTGKKHVASIACDIDSAGFNLNISAS